MRDKLLQIRVDDAFLSKLDYLRKIHGFRSIAETVRHIVEKEYRKEVYHMMAFEKLTDEQKRECYKSYCEDVRYEFGDRVKPMSYEEWCEESKKFGEALM